MWWKKQLNHRKSDATQPLQKKGLSELAVHKDRSHSPSQSIATEQKLFTAKYLRDDDKEVMSEADAPDKDAGNDSFDDNDWKGALKFTKIETLRPLVTDCGGAVDE